MPQTVLDWKKSSLIVTYEISPVVDSFSFSPFISLKVQSRLGFFLQSRPLKVLACFENQIRGICVKSNRFQQIGIFPVSLNAGINVFNSIAFTE